jgi:tetratricopeptide (TPR) repeat protein
MQRVRPATLVYVALAGLTLAVYLPACGNGFVNYDDDLYVTANPHVQRGVTAAGLQWAWRTHAAANWHPLTWVSLQLDSTLAGRRVSSERLAGVYHLTNVLLHLATVLLLFAVLRGMTGAVWRSALVAALFAVHPLHVESVAWVSERKDVLCAFFGVAALGAYSWYARRPGVMRYLAVAALFGLGLMAKPMLVTLPCVLLLLDYWPLRRWRLAPAQGPLARSASEGYSSPSLALRANGPGQPSSPARPLWWLLVEKVPLLLLTAADSVLTWTAQWEGQAFQPLERLPLAVRAGNALVAYAAYLGKTFWPVRLAALYAHPGLGLSWAQVAVAAALLAAVTAVVVCAARRVPYAVVGWLWFLGMLVPTIGLTQVGPQAYADRFTYLPHVGLFIALVWGTADLVRRVRLRPVAVALGVVAVAGCAVLARVQVSYWHDSVTLWEHTLAVTDDNFLAHYHLANFLAANGRAAEAVAHYRASLAIQPDHWPAQQTLTAILIEQGRREEARQVFDAAMRFHPGDAAIRRAYARLLNAHGAALANRGRTEEAEAFLTEAVAVDGDFGPARRNLERLLRDRAGGPARQQRGKSSSGRNGP